MFEKQSKLVVHFDGKFRQDLSEIPQTIIFDNIDYLIKYLNQYFTKVEIQKGYIQCYIGEGSYFKGDLYLAESIIEKSLYQDRLGMPVIYFKSGQPCNHNGCIAHTGHPCEVCGRINAHGDVQINSFDYAKIIDKYKKPLDEM